MCSSSAPGVSAVLGVFPVHTHTPVAVCNLNRLTTPYPLLWTFLTSTNILKSVYIMKCRSMQDHMRHMNNQLTYICSIGSVSTAGRGGEWPETKGFPEWLQAHKNS